MIVEDYVSLETAKLMYEHGFTGSCNKFSNKTKTVTGGEWDISSTTNIPIPTLQMAMKWLRLIHKIFICPLFIDEKGLYGFTIENIADYRVIATSNDTNALYDSPESACEAAIKYCLENLI